MKRLLKYFEGLHLACLMGPLLKLLEALLELIVPLVVAKLIDNGIGNRDSTYCVRMCLVLVVLAAVGLAASVIAQYFSAKASVYFASNVRSAVFAHIQTLSFKDIDKLGTDTLITRLTSDINTLQNGVNMALRLLLRSPFIVFGAMIMAFTRDASAAMVFVAVIPALSVVVFSVIAVTIPGYKKVQKKLDEVLSLTRENVNGVRVIRAFRNEEKEKEKFAKANGELRNLSFAAARVSALTNPLTQVIINAGIIVLIYVCGIRVDNGYISVGVTVALYNYMSQILVELIKLANLIVTITKALASANRVADVLDIEPGMEDGKLSLCLDKDDEIPAVWFDHASIAYHEGASEAISDVNLKVYPGQTVGIIGGTGSGKSTLVHLIPRFYDVTGGSVKVFGNDVKEIREEELRERIGIVMQKAVLFKGDIRSNLEFANPDGSVEDMKDALYNAQAYQFVVGSEDGDINEGLEKIVEQGGNNLSGGQKQRVSIARALVKKPDILILDDSASALDYATDAALRKAIKNLDYNPTTFIVSQRASSVQYADVIVVLDDGKVSGIGTHDELLKENAIYREIYNTGINRKNGGKQVNEA